MSRALPYPGALHARTRRLDADVDLLAAAGGDGYLFEQHGAGLAGRGVALRVPVEQAEDALASVVVDDEVRLPGTGAVAFGALPFDRRRAAEVVVPELVVGRAGDGTRWATTIGDRAAVLADRSIGVAAGATAGAGSFRITPGRPAGDWCGAVVAARDAIRAGRLDKVVLARDVAVECDAPLDVAGILARLRAAFPSCFVFSMDGFVGASPELLVSRTGDVVRSHPLAGTLPRTGDPDADARLAASLLSSTKDQVEHRITIDMVHRTLLPWCSYLDAEAEPSVVPAGNVVHLGTLVEGRLSAPLPSALELVRALHPTPAVGGSPREVALGVIDELEGMDRGRYAGPVGWMDAVGNGRWAVGIRSAEIDGSRARLFAGVGVVHDSAPDAELAETRAKLQPMLTAIVRP